MAQDLQLQSSASLPNRSLSGKKILIIVENLPVPFDRRVWLEATTLASAGAAVTVICPTGKGFEKRDEVIDGIQIFRHPLPDAGSAAGYIREYAAALYWETRLAFKAWRAGRFDVIHACNPPDLIFLVAVPYKLFGVKFIFDHHDINPELYEAKFGRRGLMWRMLSLMERLTFFAADSSIATNESYRAIAIDRGGMAPEKVTIVRSGPDLKRFLPAPRNDALKRGRRYLVGYIGVIGEQEGIDLLLASVEHMVRVLGRTDVQFCLVGDGPSAAGMRQLAADKGLSAYVDFLGRVPDRELLEVLSTADVCVNPDRVNAMNNSSTMNKIIEYMAMSCPIVQFDVVEGRRSALDASLYARPNDPEDFANKICELLADPEKRLRMGQFGRSRVEQTLAWEHQVEPLLAHYHRTLQG